VLYGADYLRFPSTATGTDISGSFVSKENANVYVFRDVKDKASMAWLQAYEKTTDTVRNSSGTLFNVFKKEVGKGKKVIFKNYDEDQKAAMFSIAVVPKYTMGEENDGRPILKLEAEQAKTTGEGVIKAFFKKSDYVEFTENTDNNISFEVDLGVANIYLLRFRFMNMNVRPVEVNLKIEDANGILVRDDMIEFPVQNEKWKILNTTSGGYINAGTYKIQITSDQMKGLRLESFEFQ
jgi:hypothetical protein